MTRKPDPRSMVGSHMRTADRAMKNDDHAGAESERTIDATNVQLHDFFDFDKSHLVLSAICTR